MPYVDKDRRPALDEGGIMANAGDLNYMITNLILRYMNTHNPGYQALNDIVGALEGAKMEFYRRKVIPYENIKIKENGDCY